MRPTQTLSRRFYVAILILALGIIAVMTLSWYLKSPPSQPDASNPQSQSYQLKQCGDLTLTTIKLGKSGHNIIRSVATFYPWQCASKDSVCHYAGQMNAYADPACNPGAIYDLTGNTDPNRYDEKANVGIICSTTTDGRRIVNESTKLRTYLQYSIGQHSSGSFEVDHIVSLTLGGANGIANLYPQPARPAPGFHQKDAVEGELGRAICQGKLTLHEAQDIITHSWIAYFDNHTLAPVTNTLS